MNLLETIKVTDGHFQNLDAHLERMNKSCRELFGLKSSFILNDMNIPISMRKGVVKCRIVYNTSIAEISYSAYHPKKVNSLRMVSCDDIDYHLKYADRSIFDRLLELRDGCDDILIVKNGFITDTSYSNVAFSDGKSLYVPRTFLLNGCKRRWLIETGLAREVSITPADICSFEKVHLINAMLEPGEITLYSDKVFF